MDSILRDLRYGLKLLVRDRAFSLTVLITLGVCLGANIAVFSVVQTVVLSPLPFRQPERLVAMYNLYPGAGWWSAARIAPPTTSSAGSASTDCRRLRHTSRQGARSASLGARSAFPAYE